MDTRVAQPELGSPSMTVHPAEKKDAKKASPLHLVDEANKAESGGQDKPTADDKKD